MKKPILIHLYNDRSGSPKILSQVAETLELNGIEYEIITSSHKYGFLNERKGKKTTVFYKRSENKIVTLAYYLACQLHLFLICLKYYNKDVQFYINTMMPAGAAIAAGIIRKDVIFHIHETSVEPKILKKTLRLIIKIFSKKIIFVSNYLSRKEKFNNKTQIVVRNAITSKGKTQKKINSRFIVIMACSLKTYKGIFELIEIARITSSHKKIEFQLIINADNDEIKNYIGEISIPVNLKIFPRQQDLHLFYSNSDLILNLSRPDQWIETFGLTIVEAMSYGIPAIAPPVGGPAEIVEDKKNGYLISCYDTDLISQKIIEIADNQELQMYLRKNSLEKFKEFDIDTFRTTILNILK